MLAQYCAYMAGRTLPEACGPSNFEAEIDGDNASRGTCLGRTYGARVLRVCEAHLVHSNLALFGQGKHHQRDCCCSCNLTRAVLQQAQHLSHTPTLHSLQGLTSGAPSQEHGANQLMQLADMSSAGKVDAHHTGPSTSMFSVNRCNSQRACQALLTVTKCTARMPSMSGTWWPCTPGPLSCACADPAATHLQAPLCMS